VTEEDGQARACSRSRTHNQDSAYVRTVIHKLSEEGANDGILAGLSRCCRTSRAVCRGRMRRPSTDRGRPCTTAVSACEADARQHLRHGAPLGGWRRRGGSRRRHRPLAWRTDHQAPRPGGPTRPVGGLRRHSRAAPRRRCRLRADRQDGGRPQPRPRHAARHPLRLTASACTPSTPRPTSAATWSSAFCGLKDLRRIGTRYDKLACTQAAAVCLLAIVTWWNETRPLVLPPRIHSLPGCAGMRRPRSGRSPCERATLISLVRGVVSIRAPP